MFDCLPVQLHAYLNSIICGDIQVLKHCECCATVDVCGCLCISVCEKNTRGRGLSPPLSHWLKILCKSSKKPVTVCLIIFGCSGALLLPASCPAVPSSPQGRDMLPSWGRGCMCAYPGLVSINLPAARRYYLRDIFKIHTNLW